MAVVAYRWLPRDSLFRGLRLLGLSLASHWL